jgi:hypothetical protein
VLTGLVRKTLGDDVEAVPAGELARA